MDSSSGILLHGAAMIDLLAHPQRWVRRRVEQIELLDEQVTKRSVSVDFKLPRWYAESPEVKKVGQWMVPLGLLAKQPLSNFDLRDEEGSCLSLVSSEESGLIAAATLIFAAGAVLRRFGRERDEEAIAEDLELVATCKRGEAKAAVSRALESGGLARESRLLLAGETRARRLIEDFAESFPVLTPISSPSQARVLKLSYEEGIKWPSGPFDRIGPALAWRPAPFSWVAGGVGMGQSFHCEVGVPEDLEITSSLLTAEWPNGTQDDSGKAKSQRVHLYLSGVPSDANGVLEVAFRVDRRGLIFSSAALGLVTSLLLTLGAIFPGNLSGDATETLLITVPALLAAYIAKPGEHPLTGKLLLGVRVLVGTIGVLSFLAAATLAMGLGSGLAMILVWSTLAGMAWIATLGLTISVFRSAPPG
jgi:hypothetical protein